MPLKKVREEEIEARELHGLVDGGHVFLQCSNCDAFLLDVWRTAPADEPVWKVKAKNCPFCDEAGMGQLGGSFIKEVSGFFHVGGFALPREDDPDDDIPSTIDVDFDTDDDTITYSIAKANPNAHPIRRLR